MGSADEVEYDTVEPSPSSPPTYAGDPSSEPPDPPPHSTLYPSVPSLAKLHTVRSASDVAGSDE